MVKLLRHLNKLKIRADNIVFYSTSSRSQSIKRPDGWESVIGLEVHTQIDSNTKLFSSAPNQFRSSVNSNVSLFDAAIPGTLPVINKRCVEAAVLTSLALSCKINEESYFDRKHYFYADLPAGYQITQQRRAVANDGHLNFLVYNTESGTETPYYHTAKIRQIQLEQDSGKSIHDEEEQRSLIDLNRAGVGLIEIVFEPDLRDGEEAGALVKELINILISHRISSCKMEEGGLRVDANISVHKKGEPLGVRTEVKNISSIRSLVHAVEWEVRRQIQIKNNGGQIVNETRSFDGETRETVAMRDKEVKQDYRFMPEPNLPPLRITLNPPEKINKNLKNVLDLSHLVGEVKELPDSVRHHLINKFSLKFNTALIISNEEGLGEYFKSTMKFLNEEDAVPLSNLLTTQMMEVVHAQNSSFTNCPLSPCTFSQVFKLVRDNRVNLEFVPQILTLILKGDSRSPLEIINDQNWSKMSDDGEIRRIIELILTQNSKIVENYTNLSDKKKRKILNKIMGMIRKETDGKLDMKKADEILNQILSK